MKSDILVWIFGWMDGSAVHSDGVYGRLGWIDVQLWVGSISHFFNVSNAT